MSLTIQSSSWSRTPSASSSPGRLVLSSLNECASTSRSTYYVETIREAISRHQGLTALAIERQARFGSLKLSWRVRNCFQEWRRLTRVGRRSTSLASSPNGKSVVQDSLSPGWQERMQKRREDAKMVLLGDSNLVSPLGNSVSPAGKSKAFLSDRDLLLELQSSMMDREDVIRSLQHRLRTCERDCDCLVHELESKTGKCSGPQEERIADLELLRELSEKQIKHQEDDCSRQLALYKAKVSDLELLMKEFQHDAEARHALLSLDHEKQLKRLDEEWDARLQESLDKNSILQQDHAREMQQLRKEMDSRLQDRSGFNLLESVAVAKLRHEHESHVERLEQQWQERLADLHDRNASLQKELDSHCKLSRDSIEARVAQEEHMMQTLFNDQQVEQMRLVAAQHSANETAANCETAKLKASLEELDVAAQRLQVASSGMEQKEQQLSAARSEVASLRQEMEQMRLVVEQPSANEILDRSATSSGALSSPGAVRCTNPGCSALNMVDMNGPPIVQCGSCGLDIEFDLGVCDASETRNESHVGFEVGIYQIIHAAIVREGSDIDSRKVADVWPDARVRILEVKDFEDRIRARIDFPPGWISIVNKNTGALYATKVPTSPTLERFPMTSEILSSVEQNNATLLQSPGSLPVIDEQAVVRMRAEEKKVVPQTVDCEVEQYRKKDEAIVELDLSQAGSLEDTAFSTQEKRAKVKDLIGNYRTQIDELRNKCRIHEEQINSGRQFIQALKSDKERAARTHEAFRQNAKAEEDRLREILANNHLNW